MFSHAYEIAFQYTMPVLLSYRTLDTRVWCTGGAFVVLNKDGWIITVAHIFEAPRKYQQDQANVARYYEQVRKIRATPGLDQQAQDREIAKLASDPNWITTFTFWWAQDGVTLQDVKLYPELDLAIGRLEPFRNFPTKVYPKIKNPDHLKPGTSLCKLGFPFHQVSATFDEQKNLFVFAPGSVPVPVFPMEGILTRFKIGGKTSDNRFDIKHIETSSPGLRGQSGGPIFDTSAVVWGIQSKTDHLQLGFSPRIVKDGKEIEENQFINVGLGVHPETIIKVLNENNIQFELAD
jgi:hypothetical protein